MMQLTNKRSSKIQANYPLEATVLENVESIKYLGVTITNDACVCYREIKNEDAALKLLRDIDRLGNWARKWGMRL